MGRALNAAGTYRRYAAECLTMVQRSQTEEDRAKLVEMAAMWQRLADYAHERSTDNSPPGCQAQELGSVVR